MRKKKRKKKKEQKKKQHSKGSMARKLVSFSVPVSVFVSVSACVEMYLYLHAACCIQFTGNHRLMHIIYKAQGKPKFPWLPS